MAVIKRKPKNYYRGGRVAPDPHGQVQEMVALADDLMVQAHAEQEAIFAEEKAQMQREHADALDQQIAAHGDNIAAIGQQPEETTLDRLQEAARRLAPKVPPIKDQIAALMEDDPARHKAALFYHSQALAMGLPDDSPEMAAAIEHGVRHEQAKSHQDALDKVRGLLSLEPAAPPPPVERPKRIPLAAPVSRSSPSWDGKRDTSRPNRITLSPEEREIARLSDTRTNVSDDVKEFNYAMGKKRMLAMKAAGTIE